MTKRQHLVRCEMCELWMATMLARDQKNKGLSYGQFGIYTLESEVQLAVYEYLDINAPVGEVDAMPLRIRVCLALIYNCSFIIHF